MASRVRKVVGQNLRHPNGVWGNIVSKLVFDKGNVYLEKNAARLCGIMPHHKVLEVGFGPGHGMKAAYEYVKAGTGSIYGIDYSELMVKKANKKLKAEIKEGKIDLTLGSVMNLPYNTDMFDSVFHCNCYYFWSNIKHATQELYRVMKPGAVMVATLNSDSVRRSHDKGYIPGNPDPIRYMWALEQCGFEDVSIEYMNDGDKKFQAIFARIHEKVAYDEDFEEEVEEDSEVHGKLNRPARPVEIMSGNAEAAAT